MFEPYCEAARTAKRTRRNLPTKNIMHQSERNAIAWQQAQLNPRTANSSLPDDMRSSSPRKQPTKLETT
eukprot:9480643-Lingulodinium_polyedra.AAC.1